MITGIHHFSIACADADRSLVFYRDVFGMRVLSDRDVEPDGFVERVTGVAGAHVRIVHLQGYGVNFELLEYKPVTVVGGPNDGGKALYLEDPDANAVEVLELARPWPAP